MKPRASARGLLAAVGLAAGLAAAAPRLDPFAGTWRDEFGDLDGLDVNGNIQGALAPPSGFTVNPGVFSWSQPSAASGLSVPFSSVTTYEPTVDILLKGTSGEQLTLWRKRYDPGGDLDLEKDCFGVPTCPCISPNNGNVADFEFGTIWGEGSSAVPGAVWGGYPDISVTTVKGVTTCNPAIPNQAFTLNAQNNSNCTVDDGAPKTSTIAQFTNEAILHFKSNAGSPDLKPGYGYSVTFLTAVYLGKNHVGHANPYLRYELREAASKTVYRSATLLENQFLLAGGILTSAPFIFTLDVTPVTLDLSPVPPSGGWDFRVVSLVPPRDETLADGTCDRLASHPHFTALGPVYLTADHGAYTSPVLDTLSDNTRWLDLEWDLRQTTTASTAFTTNPDPETLNAKPYKDNGDPLTSVSLIPEGSPLTPVKLSYQVGNAAPLSVPFLSVSHGGEAVAGLIGMNMVTATRTGMTATGGAPLVGRFFQYGLELHSRSSASLLDPDLAPANGINPNSSPDPGLQLPYPNFLYFGAFRPVVNRVTVHYAVCAARAVSRAIAPSSVRRWGVVRFAAQLPSPGCRIGVDVMTPDGKILVNDAASGTPLARFLGLDVPVLQLSASLFSDPADCGKRPTLLWWEVTWEPLAGVVELARNSIRPGRGEACMMQISVPAAGRVRVDVHDAAGQLVKVLWDDDLPAAAKLLSWGGETDLGSLVAPGVYFIAARVPGGGREVKRLAVIR